MKQSLQLSIGQHLTLTPQLQQAIRLLQLSTVDLQQEIQLVVESNPMLEATPVEEKEELAVPHQHNDENNDFQWSQLYSGSKSTSFEDNDYNFDNLHCTTTNLQDHLRWQLELSPMSDVDRVIATAIIDAINDDGFLTASPNDLHISLNSDEFPIDFEEVEAVRHKIQLFDPVGCATQNLAETLLVQACQLDLDPNRLALIKNIITQDMELLGQHNYKQLMKNHQISEKLLMKYYR